MSSKNKTDKLNLSQFAANDKPSWLNDYNMDMKKIDSGFSNKANFDWVYPVGSYYISSLSTNPAEMFGFGIWERAAIGRMLLGVDGEQEALTEAGKTGGEAQHTLTVDEMPSHSHGINRLLQSPGGSLGILYDINTPYNTEKVGTTGGNQPHNNMPPYETAYIWRRVK